MRRDAEQRGEHQLFRVRHAVQLPVLLHFSHVRPYDLLHVIVDLWVHVLDGFYGVPIQVPVCSFLKYRFRIVHGVGAPLIPGQLRVRNTRLSGVALDKI